MLTVQTRRFDAPPIDRGEILRYALCRAETPDVAQLIDQCLDEAQKVLTYAVCWAEFPVPQEIASESLSRRLHGCDRVIAFAATAGLGMDRLIARYGRLSPSKGVILQAIGAERIEALCDAFEAYLRAQGLQLRPRFSPGYGDLPLSAQREIFAALDCHRHIGLSLNDSLLMSPSKSVTALIGVGGGACEGAGCDGCAQPQCEFRR